METSGKYTGVLSRASNTKRHNQRPDRAFYIRYNDNTGKRILKQVGWASEGMTAELAARKRTEILAALNNPEEQVETIPDITLNEFMQEYLEWAATAKKDAAANDQSRWKNHLKPVFGKRLLKEISPYLIEKAVAKWQADLSAKTIKNILALLKAVFNKAILWNKYNGYNPVLKVKGPAVDNARERYLTRDEAKALLDALAPYPDLHDITLLALGTGMRFGEIANLRWTDFNMEAGTLHIKDPKSGKSRHAYVSGTVLDMLRRRQREGRHPSIVFPTGRGTVMNEVSNTWQRIVDGLGLNDGVEDTRDRVVFHSLRHTFASWLAIDGVPLFTIQELMGHSSIQMTQRYARLSPDVKQRAAEELQRGL